MRRSKSFTAAWSPSLRACQGGKNLWVPGSTACAGSSKYVAGNACMYNFVSRLQIASFSVYCLWHAIKPVQWIPLNMKDPYRMEGFAVAVSCNPGQVYHMLWNLQLSLDCGQMLAYQPPAGPYLAQQWPAINVRHQVMLCNTCILHMRSTNQSSEWLVTYLSASNL